MKASEIKNKRVIIGLSQFLSTVLSPLLMPSYGVFLVLWGSFLSSRPTGDRAMILIVMFGLTCILPMIFISTLQHFGIVHNKRLDLRRERTLAYIFALACYTSGCFYLNHVHSPKWFIMFAAGGAVALLLVLLINLKWKISAHMTGIGGIVALVYTMHIQMIEAFDMQVVLIVTIMLAGCLGTARIILGRHDFAQVITGALLGYFSVKLMMMLFG